MAVTGTGVLAGRYVMLDVLGTGGMATVWRARDQVLGREVAVKVLSPQYAADPGFLARFEREARHAARLSHPRLVTVFDSGIDGTCAFIVMELVAGPTLRQVLDQAGPLPDGEAVRIAAAVCEALEVAHAAGLVHRDIKPANIVLAGGGEVKVLDFGIARADGGTAGTVGVLGTAAYLSPEQASGRAAGRSPTCTPWAACCLRCSPGRRRSPPAPRSAWPTGRSMTTPACHRRGAPGCPAGSTRSPGGCWPRTRPGRPAGAAAARAALLAALTPDATAVLTPAGDPEPGRPGRWRPRLAEAVLTAALAASLIALAAVLLAGVPGHPRSSPRLGTRPPRTRPPSARPPRPATRPHGRRPAPCPRPPQQLARSSATCKPPSPTAR